MAVSFCELKVGSTPAHLAALVDSDSEKLKLIVAACPACIDVQSKDNNIGVGDSGRDTPLHIAAHNGADKNIQILLSAGCNYELMDQNRRTPYERANKNGILHSAELIKQL